MVDKIQSEESFVWHPIYRLTYKYLSREPFFWWTVSHFPRTIPPPSSILSSPQGCLRSRLRYPLRELDVTGVSTGRTWFILTRNMRTWLVSTLCPTSVPNCHIETRTMEEDHLPLRGSLRVDIHPLLVVRTVDTFTYGARVSYLYTPHGTLANDIHKNEPTVIKSSRVHISHSSSLHVLFWSTHSGLVLPQNECYRWRFPIIMGYSWSCMFIPQILFVNYVLMESGFCISTLSNPLRFSGLKLKVEVGMVSTLVRFDETQETWSQRSGHFGTFHDNTPYSLY